MANKKQHNLLEMPETEMIEFIKEIKEKLQNKIVETKLWRWLFEVEDLTINGVTILENDIFNSFTTNK